MTATSGERDADDHVIQHHVTWTLRKYAKSESWLTSTNVHPEEMET
jgi:hypothetical protein